MTTPPLTTTMTPPPPPSIEATPLSIHHHHHHHHNNNEQYGQQHRIIASASSLRGNNNNNNNGTNSTLLSNDGGDIIATIVNDDSTDNNSTTSSSRGGRGRRRVVVKRMDGAIIASFELPPYSPSCKTLLPPPPSSPSPSSSSTTASTSANAAGAVPWRGYNDPILCWASFRTNNGGNGSGGGSGGRKMLCVLGNPTTLLVYDVLGDAAILATTNSNSTTDTNSSSNSCSIDNDNDDDDDIGGGPGGHTIPLPFRAKSIFAPSSTGGDGIVIVRMPSEEDYYTTPTAPNNMMMAEYTTLQQQQQGETTLGGGGGIIRSNNMMPPMPPPTPTGFSLPATPRSVGHKHQYHQSNNGTTTNLNNMASNDDDDDDDDDEELSLEGPPEPVRFPNAGGGVEGDVGFVNQGGSFNNTINDNDDDNGGILFHPNNSNNSIGNVAAALAVPCLFSLRHPLDEIRPLAVVSNHNNDNDNDDIEEDNGVFGNNNSLSLFTNVTETLVHISSPRLFLCGTTTTLSSNNNATTSSNNATTTCPIICVTYNEMTERHTIWSLSKSSSNTTTTTNGTTGGGGVNEPLWKTTGRGTWRLLEEKTMQQQKKQEEEEGGAMLVDNNDDDDGLSTTGEEPVSKQRDLFNDEDVSMDQTLQQQQQHGINATMRGGGGAPSSFSDIHPDFTLRKLFVEDNGGGGSVVPPPPPPAAGAGAGAADAIMNNNAVAKSNDDDDDSNNIIIMASDNNVTTKNHPATTANHQHHHQRNVFLATDTIGTGDLILCIFMPNSENNKEDGATTTATTAATTAARYNDCTLEEPAILRCYSLHLAKEVSNKNNNKNNNKSHTTIKSVSHLTDLPCMSAQPVQSVPIPLAPFSLNNNNNNDNSDGGGGSIRSRSRRRRNTSRFQTVNEDTLSTDILVLHRQQLDHQQGADGGGGQSLSFKLGLYRAGSIPIANFTLPQLTLDTIASTPSPSSPSLSSPSTSSSRLPTTAAGLANPIGNRIDVQFTNDIIVRASFSLVLDTTTATSPITEGALRAMESSLVHHYNAAAATCGVEEEDASILPYLIRADCVRLFQQHQRRRSDTTSKVDRDDCWHSLTEVLINLLLGRTTTMMMMMGDIGEEEEKSEQQQQPPSASPASSAWESLLQSDFHSTFTKGEGQMLFSHDDDILENDLSLVDSACSKNDNNKNDNSTTTMMLSSLQCATTTKQQLTTTTMKHVIFDALHQLHEDSRLVSQSRGSAWTQKLGLLLLYISEEMSPCMEDYVDHYRRCLSSSGDEGEGLYSLMEQQYHHQQEQQQRGEGEEEKKERLSNFEIVPCIMTCLDGILHLDDEEGDDDDAATTFGNMSGYQCLMMGESGLNGVCSHTWMVLRLFGILFDAMSDENTTERRTIQQKKQQQQSHRDRAAIMAMLDEGIYHSMQLQDELPMGVSLPLLEAIRRCRLDPPNVDSSTTTTDCRWPPAAYDLVGRNDLAEFLSHRRSSSSSSRSGHHRAGSGSVNNNNDHSSSSSNIDPDNDGLVPLETYSSMVFPTDNRIREAARLLRSSRPLFLRVPRPPELSDHDYERSKQESLLLLCRRSIALSLGRGMVTLGTAAHNVLLSGGAEQLLIPNIVLAGRVPPANGTLALDMSSCPANFRVWPEFHNGVAAGLRLPRNNNGGGGGANKDKNERTITRTWIKFNKPVAAADNNAATNNAAGQTPTPSYAHGGFLMALGLRGYLSALTTTDLTDYLTQGTITTTVGIFLGMAANKRGTCDPSVSKMLCLHVPSLLPPSFIPMDLASTVQAGAVAGIGLLYQGSSHRLMTEFLLNEIGRQPMKDQNSNDREGFAFVCGLSLGIVNLGKGTSSVSGLEDLRIEERLHRYITGRTDGSEFHGRKEGFDATVGGGGGAQGEMDRNSRIYEVNSLNRDITAPGATLALGLMYIKSHNMSVASSLQLPDTHFALDYIRPDLLALRVISRSLILWNDMQPTPEWIDSQIPTIVKKSVHLMKNAAKKAMTLGSMPDTDQTILDDEQTNNAEGVDKAKKEIADFDPQAVRQANAFIIAGACFSLGLKYAGSANRAAASAIIERALWFLELRDNKDVVTLTQRPDNSTLITCLCTAAISLAMVMAGTGDLDSFRLFRALRWKCDDGTLYGTHMAFGAAIGLLFLGGGKCTLGSRPEDVAMLIAAFYPHFPILSSDNQYHLQALRHLYVLAVHERILEAVDVDSHEKVCIPIELSLANSHELVQASTPYLVANDSNFVELRSKSDRYYPIVVNATDWGTRGNLSTLFVKRKAGHLSYLQDPNGLRSLSMQTGSADRESFLKSIKLFSDDAMLTSFVKYFCFSSFNDDASFERFCSDIAYECMKEEKSELLPTYLKIFRLIESKGRKKVSVEDVWNAKLLRTYVETRESLRERSCATHLVNREYISLLCERMDESFHISESLLSSLAHGHTEKWWDDDKSLGSFLIWSEIPIKYNS